MRSPVRLAAASLALALFFVTPAFADEPAATVEKSTLAAVQKQLVKPLKEQEEQRSRFSRVMRPPTERRVRVTSAAPITDAAGRAFVAFAVDQRWSRAKNASWEKGEIVGCFYPQSGEVYVQHGDAYAPARRLLGKRVKDAPDVCVQAPAAQLARR